MPGPVSESYKGPQDNPPPIPAWAFAEEAPKREDFQWCKECGGTGMPKKYDPRDVRNAPPALRDAIMENAAEIVAGPGPSPFTALEAVDMALSDAHLLFRRIARKAVKADQPEIEELARHGVRILQSIGYKPNPLRDDD